MAKSLDVLWSLEPHTAAKHAILRRYLQAWFAIMASSNERILYIDGFAGPGEYAGGEDGSPIIALKAALEHGSSLSSKVLFVFMEEKQPRCAHLEQLVSGIEVPPNFEVKLRCCRFDEKMTEVLDYLDQQIARLAPTFAFVDPFGYSDTPLAVIERIMAHKKCEVLITFMYEEVNRFIDHPDRTQHAHFDRLFGTNEWRKARDLREPQERKRFIHDLYLRQLRRGAGIAYVRSFEMVNRGNRTDYYLFFGTKNLLGLRKMKEAMWSVDPTGGNRFSDSTDYSQPVLFDLKCLPALREAIVSWMEGRTVTIGQVERFALTHTPFRETHVRKAALKPLEEEGRLEVLTERHRPLTYPAGTKMRLKA